MFAPYLVATIVGGGALAASLLFGHDTGGHALEHGSGHADHGGSLSAILLSLRFWTYLAAFGGLSGMLLGKVDHLGEPYNFLISAGMGAVCGVGAQLAIAKFGGDKGGTVRSRDLVYRLGVMLLPASRGVSSRVRVTVNNQTVDLIALTDDESIAAREEVLILDVKDGVAQVTRNQPAGETK